MSSTWRNASSRTQEESNIGYPVDSLRFAGAMVILSFTAWLTSRSLGSRTATRDTVMLTLLLSLFCGHEVFNLTRQVASLIGDAYIYLLPLLLVNALQLAYLSGYITRSSSANTNTITFSPHDSAPLKPLIFQSITKHTRLFPRHHSFQYTYLLVGVPVDWRGHVGTLLSSDESEAQPWWRASWLSVNPEDYLLYTRNQSNAFNAALQPPSLREKLNAYLLTQSITNPSLMYPHAYLVTAPRVLGFSFNPVSFWYLYDGDICLKAMILEVNNTFGERRMYFLPEDGEACEELGAECGSGEEKRKGNEKERGRENEIGVAAVGTYEGARVKKFKTKWSKDFHVSPFNDREGVYSLTALDPLARLKRPRGTQMPTLGNKNKKEGEVQINNIITLSSPRYDTLSPSATTPHSSLPHLSPKIIASITSLPSSLTSHSCIDPTTLSLRSHSLHRILFLLRWLLSGFLTNPRIVAEARKLWVKGLKVWFRPEVNPTTMGREESQEEAMLERMFRAWLEGVAKESGPGLELAYESAAGEDRGKTILLGQREGRGVEGGEQELKNKGMNGHTTSTAQADYIHTPFSTGSAETPPSSSQSQPNPNLRSTTTKTISVKVLTPLFYAELIREPSFQQVWRNRCFDAKDGEAMVYLSGDDKLVFKEIVEDYLRNFSGDPALAITGGFGATSTSGRGTGGESKIDNGRLQAERQGSFITFVNDDLRNGKPLLEAMTKATLHFLNPAKYTPRAEQVRLTKDISFAHIVHQLSSASPTSSSSISKSHLRAFEVSSFKILLADRLAVGSTTLLDFFLLVVKYSLLVWAAYEMRLIVRESATTLDVTSSGNGAGKGGVGRGDGFETMKDLGWPGNIEMGMMTKAGRAMLLMVGVSVLGRVSG